jgi:1,4-dihydroxy-6-naphthoate synthase
MPDTARISLAHSPDADDLVMFWPLVGRMDMSPASPPRFITGQPDIEPVLTLPSGPVRLAFDLAARDVEELNRIVVGGQSTYDVTAISCAAYPRVADRYAITPSGASFGEGYGPKVVAFENQGPQRVEDLRGARIAVPGLNTTAFLTLSLMLGSTAARPAFTPVPMLFSAIPGAVARGQADAGVLIHEAQLAFSELGLIQLADLGAWWTKATAHPLPLGLNVVRRALDQRLGLGAADALADLLARSVRHAAEHRARSIAFLRQLPGSKPEWHDDALVNRYLDMYVSPLTLDMGQRGRAAIAELLSRGAAAGLVPALEAPIR